VPSGFAEVPGALNRREREERRHMNTYRVWFAGRQSQAFRTESARPREGWGPLFPDHASWSRFTAAGVSGSWCPVWHYRRPGKTARHQGGRRLATPFERSSFGGARTIFLQAPPPHRGGGGRRTARSRSDALASHALDTDLQVTTNAAALASGGVRWVSPWWRFGYPLHIEAVVITILDVLVSAAVVHDGIPS
jgi:hypothetical protein